MAILDPQGRLFGKINLLDFGAILVILLSVAAVFLFPGQSGSSVAQIGTKTESVEVDMIIRGLSVANPQELLKAGEKANVIIRNQPYGEIDVKAVKILPQEALVPMSDGTVKVLKDPRIAEGLVRDLIVTLSGQAQVTPDGVVLGNSKLKVGTPIQLEGFKYDLRGGVMDVRVLGKS
ncbi:DUF4330 domain-containing protein [Leptolyngbya sp. FACHB-261]|uniref:DUF4330 domain-containing protein n=1 Tax=Leptolyngbya sp. FACHB-261 TaxID=2692806 RepID=UPI001687FC24|nr:DUF4330 domain-containing protein [Leptolyngbya sp. FACHB-261]MBD2100741.1 DUF4330 domain-containing protein [Leptolyngbya sp. FACHB-261]